MLAVLFSEDRLLISAGADEAVETLQYWGVPFAIRGTPEGTEICKTFPVDSIWIVSDTVETVLLAQQAGSPAIFVGSDSQSEKVNNAIAISSLYEIAEALRPHYARAALALRDIVASEFESS